MTLAFATRRRCGTCRHFRRSPIPGQGWCTNPAIVKPPSMVLVRDRELRCARPLAESPDFWEPADGVPAEPRPSSTSLRTVRPVPASSEPAPDPVADDRVRSYPAIVLEKPDDLVADPIAEERFEDEPAEPARRPRITEDPFPTQRRGPNRRVIIAAITVPIVLCLLGVAAVVGYFSLNDMATASRPVTPTAVTRPLGEARQDFRLRAEARNDAASVAQIPKGTKLRLINSTAGEILDQNAVEPAKWYRVQTIDGRVEGWAYAAWVAR